MKKRIRALSLLLAAAMTAGLLTVPAAAAGSKTTIKQVEAGQKFSLAVTSNGDLYAWGKNSGGQGGGFNVGRLFGSESTVTSPVKIMSGVKSVAAGSTENQPVMTVSKSDAYGSIIYGATPGNVLLIIKENGDLYTWGDNTCYQLGKGYYEASQDFYEPYFVMSHVVDAATNDHACAAVTESGDLYFWGHNITWGHGNDITELYESPTKILTGVKSVEMGSCNVVALKNDGSVWMMGSTYRGAMAVENNTAQGTLVNLMTKIMDGCIDIAAGAYFTMALKADGTLYGWGNNDYGVLNIHWNLTNCVTTPTVIATGVRSVEAGNHNAYFIKSDNSLWVTGDGQKGQRGQGNEMSYFDTVSNTTKRYHYYPEQVDTDVRSVSAGTSHMLYLKNDGTMWGCGFDDEYQMGRGDVWGEELPTYGHSAYCWRPVQCGLSYGAYAGRFGSGFRDVASNAYYYDPVQWAVDRGVTNGTSDTSFSPDQTCTRAQIITFLYRAAGEPKAEYLHPIWDVTADQYYFNAVMWAAENGIIPSMGNFEPNAPCTRAMAMEFMWGYADHCEVESRVSFTDVPADASYAGAVKWAVYMGITTGTTNTTFSPEQICTRGQIVTFLYRLFG